MMTSAYEFGEHSSFYTYIDYDAYEFGEYSSFYTYVDCDDVITSCLPGCEG